MWTIATFINLVMRFLLLATAAKKDDGAAATVHNRVVSGHPKVNASRQSVATWLITPRDNTTSKILWSSHHTIDAPGWTNFSLFLDRYQGMLAFAKAHNHIDMVFSPHPALITLLNNLENAALKKQVDDFFTNWRALDNTTVATFLAHFPLFKSADVLLVDGISWLLECQLINKPIVFLARKDHLPFNESSELVATGLNRVTNINEAIDLLLKSSDGFVDPHKENQGEVVGKLLAIDGIEQAEANILDTIADDTCGRRNGVQ